MSLGSEKVGKFSALQSTTEIGLGSLLHSLHIPLAGHGLSLNQGFLLTLGLRQESTRRSAIEFVSLTALVSGMLKALSPAGKKLTPMLAISMQGILYSVGVALGGVNFLGASLGIILLSLWGFFQPLLMAYLFFGTSFFLAVESIWIDVAENLSLPVAWGIKFLLSIVLIKIFISLVVAFLAWKSSNAFQERYFHWIKRIPVLPKKPRPVQRPSLGAFQDLLNPWFLVSFMITLCFFVFSQQKEIVPIVWYGLRVLALAWIFFWVVRAIPQSWILKIFKKFPSLEKAAHQVFRSRSRT